MASKLNISPTEVVVHFDSKSAQALAHDALAALGSVEPLPSHPSHLLLRVPKAVGKLPKKLWRKVTDALGGDVQVSPVLLDENQQPRYPVGAITARFKEALSDKELAALGASLGLESPQRNEFVPTQVSFQVSNKGESYLPDLLRQLGERDDLVAAWPETLSAYQRE